MSQASDDKRLPELDRVMPEIDHTRQGQEAHTPACSVPSCAKCVWLQAELDRLHRRYALLIMPRRVRHDR
jgi:hypothetical protein